MARNKRLSVSPWHLKGLLIGNGWISPAEQYESYLEFAYEKGLVEKGSSIATKMETQHASCLKDLANGGDQVDMNSCEAILQDILMYTQTKGSNGKQECFNMYDVRLKDTYPSCGMNWPADLVYVTPYLRRKEVTTALHINENKHEGWTECNGNVGSHFRATTAKPSIRFLPEILEQVPILLFSGAEDLICNHLGTEAFIGNMEWNGGKGFELSPGNWAPRRDWTFEGESAGFWQEARNLTYVLFYNSSHMVPFDYPRRTRDMLDRFMGVDISSIGGTPTDSRLDGEKGPETTVGGAAGNGTDVKEAEKAKLDAAKWQAYRKSGEIVLVIVIIAASAWGYYVWQDRRKRGYQGFFGGHAVDTSVRGRYASVSERPRGTGLETFRNKRTGRDIEAGDFDESELDDLHVATPTEEQSEEPYAVGEESDEEADGKEKRKGNGRAGQP